jgi:hypothetical protein
VKRKAITEREKSRERYYLFSVYTPGNNVNSSSNDAVEKRENERTAETVAAVALAGAVC